MNFILTGDFKGHVETCTPLSKELTTVQSQNFLTSDFRPFIYLSEENLSVTIIKALMGSKNSLESSEFVI